MGVHTRPAARASTLIMVALLLPLVVLLIAGCDEDDIERQLGRMTAASVEGTYGVNRDPLISDWIDHVGQTMVSFSTRQQIPYTFKVLRSDIVNAFAAPWGHIYVTEGLLDFAETEDEIWCVVGHEIGHVEHRDIMKSLKQSILFGIGASLIGDKSETLGSVAGIGLGLLSLRYSRKDEYAADDEGRILSYQAGYDPHGEIGFFERLQKEKQRGSPCYIQVLLSTHPPTSRRIDRQNNQPELDAQNTAALLHIGRGHMRRAHYTRAIKYLTEALDLKPGSVQVHTAMADALAARGQYELAAQHYQMALDQQQGDRYVGQRLAQAQNTSPLTLAALTPAESTQAQQEQDAARLLALRASTAAIQAELFAKQVDTRIAGAVRSNQQTTSGLLGLSEEDWDLDDVAQDAVLDANAAIAKAADSVYGLEQVKSLISVIAPELKQAGAEAVSCLRKMAAGEGYTGQVAIVQRSLLELEEALDELEIAQDQALASASIVQQAQNAATDSLATIQRIMSLDEDREDRRALLVIGVRQLTTLTENRANAASAAVRRAKKPAARARLRTLVAQLNLRGVAAPAAQIPALDKLVAHYTMGESPQVSQLRHDGLGYGDAALIIATSKSARLAPSQLAEGLSLDRSVVNHISTLSDSSYGARILLKFLARAMEQEVETDA